MSDRQRVGFRIDDLTHHSGAFSQIDKRNNVGRREGFGYRSAHHGVAGDGPFTADLLPIKLWAVAAIAVRSGVKQESCARFAVLQLQLTTGTGLVERLLGRGGSGNRSAHDGSSFPKMRVAWLDMMPPCA